MKAKPIVPAPTRIELAENALKDVQIAMLRQQLVQQQVEVALQRAQAETVAAFKAAGLDPAKTYTFDAATRIATEVVK